MIVSHVVFIFFFKQKTAYELRISDWSSDVCSSDLLCRIVEGNTHQLLDTREPCIKRLTPNAEEIRGSRLAAPMCEVRVERSDEIGGMCCVVCDQRTELLGYEHGQRSGCRSGGEQSLDADVPREDH